MWANLYALKCAPGKKNLKILRSARVSFRYLVSVIKDCFSVSPFKTSGSKVTVFQSYF